MLAILSRVPASTMIGKLLRFPLKILPKKLAIPVLSGVLRGKKWIIGSGIHGCWIGAYEHEKQRAFAEALRKGNMVYDIGANAGFYTLISAAGIGPEGRVFAFEPSSINCGYLRQHLDLNGLKNVTVFEAAVSDHDGQGFFDKSGNPFEGKLAESGTAVKVVSLDALFKKDELPVPDLIKIDVEGEELRVLRGAEQLLKKCSPIIFLATHGVGAHNACLEYLSSLGYAAKSLSGKDVKLADELIATKDFKR